MPGGPPSAEPVPARGPGPRVGGAEVALRREIVATAQRMNAVGINQGKAGNVSARHGSGFLVTPSAMPYEQMAGDDVVQMTMEGASEGRHAPSTEWRFHRDVYARRPDVRAIVHAHSMFATTLACLGRAIPAFHYMVAAAGGSSIPCTPYATFGTQALADHVVRGLEGRHACLLGNHGMVAVGRSLAAALALAVEVETLAAMYWRALQVGEPRILTDAEMAEVLVKFRSYGRPEGDTEPAP